MSKEIQTKEQGHSFEAWKGMRKSFIDNIQTILVLGKDFHDLNFRGKEVRVLAKGGAEKVASAFSWKATFTKDTETLEMLGATPGLVAYICKLTDKKGDFIGEGRGARKLTQDSGDPNKTIKMAQKSAFIDAILRASGLSDLFTQDLDSEPEAKEVRTVERVIDVQEKPEPIKQDSSETIDLGEPEPKPRPTGKRLQILRLIGKPKTDEEARKLVLEKTGKEFETWNYDFILSALTK